MYCPECGFAAGEDKFCPECGAQLENVRKAVRGGGPAAGQQNASATGKTTGAAKRQLRHPHKSPMRSAPRSAAPGFKPLHFWIAVVVVPLIVVISILVLANQKSSRPSP